MVNKLNSFLYFTIGCLFFLSTSVSGHCESAYELQENEAKHPAGIVPGSGAAENAGYGMKYGNDPDSSYVNKKAIYPQTVNPGIVGMLARQRNLERYWRAEIQKTDQEIQKCDKNITLANTIILKAMMRKRIEAEAVARQNLLKAEQLKRSRLGEKLLAEEQLLQASDVAKNLSGALMKGSATANVRGVVSQSSGVASLSRSNSNSTATMLTGSLVGLLEPGDEILTGNGGKAVLQILSGRGSIAMAGNSKLKVEKDHGDAEVVKTIEGKFHFFVDKVEKFEIAMEKDISTIKENLAQTADDSMAASGRFFNGIKTKIQKKLEVNSRVSVVLADRGTEFIVNEKQDGSCELLVIDGKVAATEPNEGKSIVVETGQSISISPDGKLLEVRQIDRAALTPWWK